MTDNKNIFKLKNIGQDEYEKILCEVKAVIDAFPEHEKEMINKSLFELFEKRIKDKSRTVEIDFDKPLKGQISEKARLMLAYIVRKLFNDTNI